MLWAYLPTRGLAWDFWMIRIAPDLRSMIATRA
jgi:hypothetical protein